MTRRNDAVVSIAWLVVALVLVGALVAGAVKALADFSADNAYRWIMALLFLGGSFAWVTVHHRATLRRFFKR